MIYALHLTQIPMVVSLKNIFGVGDLSPKEGVLWVNFGVTLPVIVVVVDRFTSGPVRQLPPLRTNLFQPISSQISCAVNAFRPDQPPVLLPMSAVVCSAGTVQSPYVGETQSAVVTIRYQTPHLPFLFYTTLL